MHCKAIISFYPHTKNSDRNISSHMFKEPLHRKTVLVSSFVATSPRWLKYLCPTKTQNTTQCANALLTPSAFHDRKARALSLKGKENKDIKKMKI